MSSGLDSEGVPPGAPVVPQGPVPAVGVPNSQDYPRLVYTAPRFEVVAIADIIEPSVLEACEALLPTLVPPYVNQAAIDAVNATAVRRAGDTMTGPLNLSPVIPTANAMAASKQYVDTMIATGAVPEVPPVPAGQAWARETGQWVPIAGGGTVTNIATGAGLTGGPITATGTIAMANMNGNTLKGNNTGAVAAPIDLNVGQVMTMLGAAPLNSPTFTGSPSLPTGTAAVTQPGGTSDSTVATTAFVTQMVTASSASALQLSGGTMTGPIVLAGNAAANLNPVPLQQLNTALASYAPIASPVFTGSPSLPAGSFGVTQTAGTANTSLATTAFVGAAITTATGNYLPLTGGRLSGGLASGPAATTVPGAGALTLNANTVAPPAGLTGSLVAVAADNSSATVGMDSFGTSFSQFLTRRARGTGAAPGAVQVGDVLGVWGSIGRGASAYGGIAPQIAMQAAENWTDTAQGSSMLFMTVGAGSTVGISSLQLAGNLATFSGQIHAADIMTGAWVQPLSNNSGYCGAPTQAWASVNAYALNNLSDPRDKRDMGPAPDGALDKVNALPVIVYRHTEDPADAPLRTGFDVTAIHALHPDAVVLDDEDNPRGYSLSDINALLWQAVQELSAKVAVLEGRTA